MMVATGTVGMSVTKFILGCFADFNNLDIKGQGFTRQRVIGVNVHIKFADFDHGNRAQPLVSHCLLYTSDAADE